MSPTRRLAMSAALCLLAAGCASPWKKRVVHARSGAFVYVEHEERDGAIQPQGFDHPIALTAGEVAEIFRRLLHESRRFFWEAPKEAPVFEPPEIEALAEPVSRELARLGPDERLRFLVTRNSPGGLQAKYDAVYGVAGVLFRAKDGAIHIALSAIDEPVDEGDKGRPEEMKFRDPLLQSPSLGLIPVEGARHHRGAGGEIHRRWIEIDVEPMLAAEPRAPSGASSAAAAAEQPAEEGKPAPAAAAETAAAGAEGLPVEESEPETTPPPGAGDARFEVIKERAEILRRLRDEGTITEDDYHRQLDELLKS